MKTLIMLIKRNMLVYRRDRATVLFSMLAMIIVIALNVIFLGKNNVDNLINIVHISSTMANKLVFIWIIAGIIVINCVTTSTAVMGLMVEDEDKKRMPVFLVSSVSRFKLSMSYILTAFIASATIGIITLGGLEMYLLLSGGYVFTLIQIIKIIGLIFLNSFGSSTFMFFLVSFIHSSSAFSGINTLVGSLIGFVTGMYVQMGELPSIVQNILKFIPVLHGASLMREALLENLITDAFTGQQVQIMNECTEYMGITLSYNGWVILDRYKIIFLFITGMIFMILSVFVVRNREARDR